MNYSLSFSALLTAHLRTIPIAKRRYYGRVQQAVHDFLAMAPEMKRADTTGEKVQFFFDTSGVVVVEARRQDSKLHHFVDLYASKVETIEPKR